MNVRINHVCPSCRKQFTGIEKVVIETIEIGDLIAPFYSDYRLVGKYQAGVTPDPIGIAVRRLLVGQLVQWYPGETSPDIATVTEPPIKI